MNKWYNTFGILIMLNFINQAHAQTHYGTNAGIQGNLHSFFGADAGKVNTGDYNTFVGAGAGKSNKTGFNNVFTGVSAGIDNTIGSFNIFTGVGAGFRNINGKANVFIGDEAGSFNKSGNDNSFVGYEAGFSNTSGQLNTFIGSESGHSSDSGISNTFIGNRAGYHSVSGSNNAFFGYGAGYDNTTGDKNTYLGYASGGSAGLVNATAIGALAKVTSNNSMVLGNNANVGIGVSSPTYQLQLSTDDAAKLGSTVWKIWSDKRLKKDISDFKDGLELLKQMKPVWFSYNGAAGIKTTKKFVGVIAQDMQQIAPYTIGSSVYEDSLGTKTEYLDYDANAVTYILINSVKEQQQVIEQKEKQIKDLSDRLSALEEVMTAARIGSSSQGKNSEIGDQNENGVILDQNAPNSFSQTTSINFFIPQTVKDAVLNIYSTDGVKVGSYPVKDRGQSALKLSAKTFRSGVFIYDLVTDGKSNGAKKMVVTE